jgi:hypothetical protein
VYTLRYSLCTLCHIPCVHCVIFPVYTLSYSLCTLCHIPCLDSACSLCTLCHIPCVHSVIFPVYTLSYSLCALCHIPCVHSVIFPVYTLSYSLCALCHIPCVYILLIHFVHCVIFPVYTVRYSLCTLRDIPCEIDSFVYISSITTVVVFIISTVSTKNILVFMVFNIKMQNHQHMSLKSSSVHCWISVLLHVSQLSKFLSWTPFLYLIFNFITNITSHNMERPRPREF